MDKNVCPYCGWECVEIVGSPYRGIGRGRCPNCQSNGPEVSPPSFVIDAFCHPSHLMASLHTYDPATHVVVSRECAEAALFNIPDSAEGGVSPREHAARAELRAALEVK